MSIFYKAKDNEQKLTDTRIKSSDDKWHYVKNAYHKTEDGSWHPAYTYDWVPSEWEECSKKCGGGTQSRTIRCVRNDGVVRDDCFCDGIAKPPTVQECNTQSCIVDYWHCFQISKTGHKHGSGNIEAYNYGWGSGNIGCDFSKLKTHKLGDGDIAIYVPITTKRIVWTGQCHSYFRINKSSQLGTHSDHYSIQNGNNGIHSSVLYGVVLGEMLGYFNRGEWNRITLYGNGLGNGSNNVEFLMNTTIDPTQEHIDKNITIPSDELIEKWK